MTKVRENASMGATSTGNIGTGAAGALFGGKTRTSEHVSGPNGKHEMSKMRSPTTPNKTMQQFVGESDPNRTVDQRMQTVAGQLAQKVANAVHGHVQMDRAGPWRFSDSNFTVPVQAMVSGYPVSILVSVFEDGGFSYKMYGGTNGMTSGSSPISGTGGMAQYNVRASYDQEKYFGAGEMIKDILSELDMLQQRIDQYDDMSESIQAGSLIAPNGSVAKTAPTDKTKTGLPGKQQKMMPRGEMAGVHLINPNGVQRVKEDEMPEIPDFLRRPKPANPVDTSMLGMPSRQTSASAPTEEDHHVGDAIITALKDRGVNATVTYRPSYLQSSVGIYISVAGAEGEDDVSSRGPSRWIKGVLTASFPGYHIVQRRPGFSTVEYLIRKTDAMNAVECVDIKVDAIVEWTSPRGIGYRGQIVEIDGTRLTVKTGIGTMVIEADMVDDAETDDETTEE